MSIHRNAVRACTPVLLAALSGCGSATEPVGTAQRVGLKQTFALASYDGHPLPVAVRSSVIISASGGPAVACDDYLAAVALTADTIGVATRQETYISTCNDGRADETSQVAFIGLFLGATSSPLFRFNATSGGSEERYYGEMSGTSLTINHRDVDLPAPLSGIISNRIPLVFAAVP